MTTAILLQTASSGMIQFVLLGGMFVVMYFFIIRPQQKKTKDQETFRKAIKAGDKVVTIGGLHGVVGTVEADSTVTLIVDRTIKMKFDVSAIAGLLLKFLNSNTSAACINSFDFLNENMTGGRYCFVS